MLDEYKEFESRKQFIEVLKTISSGLVSKDPVILQLTFILLTKMFRKFDMEGYEI